MNYTMITNHAHARTNPPHVLNRLVVGKYQTNPLLSQRDVQGVHTIWNVLVLDFEGNLQRGLCSFILGILDSILVHGDMHIEFNLVFCF